MRNIYIYAPHRPDPQILPWNGYWYPEMEANMMLSLPVGSIA
jgi:hypothetical protein